MGKIPKTEDNIVAIPLGVSVARGGYVYQNSETVWVDKKNSEGKTADHTKTLIGKALVYPDWRVDRRMYANETYYKLFPKLAVPSGIPSVFLEAPGRSDCISVGLYTVVKEQAERSGLMDVLVEVFGRENAWLILDLAMYMISEETAVFQHFPHWARNHAIFSDVVRSDSYISTFEKEKISLSQINLFKKKWAILVLDDGRIYLCYDSTNTNSQAEGVFLVQKGHAKDDPDLPQVNTEYVLRQRDGMPVTFSGFPGSLSDMMEAGEMFAFFEELLAEDDGEGGTSHRTRITAKNLEIMLIADRGYISEEYMERLEKDGIGFLFLLKSNMNIMSEVLEENLDKVRMPENYLPEEDGYAMTVKHKLFDDSDKEYWFHISWDSTREAGQRQALYADVQRRRESLQKLIERKSRVTEKEIERYEEYFDVTSHKEGTLKVNQRGRGAGKKKDVPGYVIDSFQENATKIKKHDSRCGYSILVSNKEMTASEALTAYRKRDCVEKMFRALKSSLGMDKFGVRSDAAMHTKSLIWFVASILRALIFNNTEGLRAKDKKHYTFPAMVRTLEEIEGDKDLETGEYKRRYKETKSQRLILKANDVTMEKVDKVIAGLAA